MRAACADLGQSCGGVPDESSVDDWPTELRLKDEGRVLCGHVRERRAFDLAGRISAGREPERRGAGPFSRRSERRSAASATFAIAAVEPVGNYAVKLVFDDGHDTGLFTWGYLHELGAEHEAALGGLSRPNSTAKGLSRESATTMKRPGEARPSRRSADERAQRRTTALVPTFTRS